MGSVLLTPEMTPPGVGMQTIHTRDYQKLHKRHRRIALSPDIKEMNLLKIHFLLIPQKADFRENF